jgi:hypothetical protein
MEHCECRKSSPSRTCMPACTRRIAASASEREFAHGTRTHHGNTNPQAGRGNSSVSHIARADSRSLRSELATTLRLTLPTLLHSIHTLSLHTRCGIHTLSYTHSASDKAHTRTRCQHAAVWQPRRPCLRVHTFVFSTQNAVERARMSREI